MKTIAQRTQNYKRATIQGFKPFVESGLLTPRELESIANNSAMNFLDQILRCEYQVKKDK
jgi:hypothetical protein